MKPSYDFTDEDIKAYAMGFAEPPAIAQLEQAMVDDNQLARRVFEYQVFRSVYSSAAELVVHGGPFSFEQGPAGAIESLKVTTQEPDGYMMIRKSHIWLWVLAFVLSALVLGLLVNIVT